MGPSVSTSHMAMLPLDTMSLTPSVLSTSPRGPLMLMHIMAMEATPLELTMEAMPLEVTMVMSDPTLPLPPVLPSPSVAMAPLPPLEHTSPMAMLPPDTMSLTPSVLSTSPRGPLMLMPIMAMEATDTMPDPSPPASPVSPMPGSPCRDMPMDMAMDMPTVCTRGDSSSSLVIVWTGCGIHASALRLRV